MSTSASDRQLLVVVLILLGILLVVPTLLMGFGVMGFGPMMGGGGMWSGGMWGGGTVPTWVPLFGAVMQLLFLVVVVGLGYLVYRAVVAREGAADGALEELRLAYARGDLSDEEYETRRETLERDG
jgi:putative membrane protein